MTLSFLSVPCFPMGSTPLTTHTAHIKHGCNLILTTAHHSPQTHLANGLDEYLLTNGMMHYLPKIRFIVPRNFPLLHQHIRRLLQLHYARIIYSEGGTYFPRWTDKGISNAIRNSGSHIFASAS